jgi:hypothetical protein
MKKKGVRCAFALGTVPKAQFDLRTLFLILCLQSFKPPQVSGPGRVANLLRQHPKNFAPPRRDEISLAPAGFSLHARTAGAGTAAPGWALASAPG